MFYGVIGVTEKEKKPYTEVYVFRAREILEWIQKITQTDMLKVSE